MTALNFNGESERSDISLLQTCTGPSLIPKPEILDVNTAFVSVQWQEPMLTGGCPITSYHLYLAGDNEGDPFTEIESTSIANNPFLTGYVFDSSSLTPGNRYRVRIGVENHVAESFSDTVGFTLADLPGTPNAPTRESDGVMLKIIMSKVSDNGGSLIQNY